MSPSAEGGLGDDGALARRAQEGDAAAFRRLYERHAPPVLALIRHVVRDGALAEEVLADAFVRAHRGLAGFDGDRPFGPWIAQIARNAAREALRARRFRVSLSEGTTAARGEDALADLARRESEERLLEALAGLEERERRVVLLRFRRGLTLVETAAELGWSRRTIASVQKAALARLARLVRERARPGGEEDPS